MVLGLRLTVLAAAIAVLLGLASPSENLVHAERVRKSWSNFSAKEKSTYLAAVKASMNSGMHYRFAELHSAKPSYDHAHGNCGFLLWHRKFILAYENMLRGQGARFKDVTLPYWNYFEDHEKHLVSGYLCGSWLECSDFLKDFGGSKLDAPTKTITVGRAKETGLCISNGVAGNACALPYGRKDKSGTCGNCIVRGKWFDGSSFVKVTKGQVISAIRDSTTTATMNAHAALSAKLEGGFHAAVHNALNGIMKTSASPYDPIFYGHHGMLDMIQFIHNRCYHDGKSAASVREYDVFTECTVKLKTDAVTTGTVQITPDSDIYMYYQGKRAEDHPEMGKFFKNVGTTYRDFANAQSLKQKSNNYRYELDSYFEKLLKSEGIRCPSYVYASSTRKSQKKKHKKVHKEYEEEDDGECQKPVEEVEEEELDDTLEELDENDGYVDNEELFDSNPISEMITTMARCSTDLRERKPNMTVAEVALQDSILECEIMRQRQGYDFEDYSDEFRDTFQIPPHIKPHCYAVMQAVADKEIEVEFSEMCRSEYGRQTETRLMEEDFGQPVMCKNSKKKHKEHKEHSQSDHMHVRVRVQSE